MFNKNNILDKKSYKTQLYCTDDDDVMKISKKKKKGEKKKNDS